MRKIEVLIEVDARIKKEEFEEEMLNVPTISFEFHQSDNLHHKYYVSTNYGTDLVWLGKVIQAFDNLLP